MNRPNLIMKAMLGLACAAMLAGATPASFAADENGAITKAAQNNIENVTYSTLQGGKLELKISLKEMLASPPVGFTTNNPPRIALDFPATANVVGKNLIEVGEGTLRSINLVQAGSRTRMVLNLAKPTGYETRMEGKELYVTLHGASVTASTANVTTRFAESVGGVQKHYLREIDFRRGSNGEGRVVVNLSDSTTGIDIRKQGKNLVVDFIDTSVPNSLERRLDVMDFGTPVKALATYGQGKNTHMVIEPDGLWEYSAYQADRQFIVDVKKVAEDPNKMVPGAKQGYAGEKLSLNFQNVEVRTVLQVIADFTNLNIITSDSVTGSLTLRLKDVPWDQALDIILNARGLDKRKNGNVVWVAPRDELAVKEKAELEAKLQVSELEPLQTEYYPLNYLRADRARSMLMGIAGTAADKSDDATCASTSTGVKAMAATTTAARSATKDQILSKRGSATFEPKTNTLIVNDIPSKHEEIRRLLAVLDVPAKQVMIEARVVLAADTFGKQLGVRMGGQNAGNVGNYNYGVSQNLENSIVSAVGIPPDGVSGPITISGGGTSPLTRTYTQSPLLGGYGNSNVNLGATNPVGALALTLLNIGSGNLVSLELSAMEADGKGNILSNPRVMTSNQRPAVILTGVEIPYYVNTLHGPDLSWRSAVLCLLVNPQILNNDSILLDVEVQKDRPGKVERDGVLIDVNRVKTQVLLNNGETAVLGGIYQEESQVDKSKVPLFGDIPVLGNLFKKSETRTEKRELMIFITPKILKESMNIQ